MDIKQLQENIPVTIQKDSKWDYYQAKNYPEEESSTIFMFENDKVKSIIVFTGRYFKNRTSEEFEKYFNEYINKIIEIYGKPIGKNENSTVIHWNRFYIVRKGNTINEYYE